MMRHQSFFLFYDWFSVFVCNSVVCYLLANQQFVYTTLIFMLLFSIVLSSRDIKVFEIFTSFSSLSFIDSFPPFHFAVTIYFACALLIPDFLLFFFTLYLLDFFFWRAQYRRIILKQNFWVYLKCVLSFELHSCSVIHNTRF